MAHRIVFKIALVLATAVAAFLLLRPRSSQLLTPIDAAPGSMPADRLTGLRTAAYDRHDVPLWTDRSYHTFHFVGRLSGLAFVPIARNEARPYVVRIDRRTTLYTIANRVDLADVVEWMITEDTVLVDDAYAPRRFDALLMREVDAGHYIVRSRQGGPSRPLFFDPRDLSLVQR